MRTRRGIFGGALFVAYAIWQADNRLSNFDWVSEQAGHAGIVGKFLQTATNVFDPIPTWLALPLGILGIALIYLDRHLADQRWRPPRKKAEPVPILIECGRRTSSVGSASAAILSATSRSAVGAPARARAALDLPQRTRSASPIGRKRPFL